MAVKNEDFEQVETKKKALRALMELLHEKPFDGITIADLCKKASLSKSTLYRNFSDKYSIVDWHTQQLLSQSIFRIGIFFTWEEGYLYFLKGLKRDAPFFMACAHSASSRSLRPGNKVTAAEDFRELVRSHSNGRLDRMLDQQCKYFSSVMIDIICDWIERGFDDSPEALARLIISMIPRDLYSVLKTPSLEREWSPNFDYLDRP